MSMIDTNSNQQLLGLRVNSSAPAPASNDQLGQDDFLKLLTTQLQNQDPFAPMDNAEFIGQMAQFSTVSGINDLNETLSSVAGSMKETRISTATNMLGHSVLVPGNIARPDTEGSINGVVDLPGAASDVRITYRDSSTGEVLHQQNLGANPAGLLGFEWQDIPAQLRESRSAVQVGVTATTSQGVQDIGASVFSRVLSAVSNPQSDDVNLEVEDFGLIASGEIVAFR